jgi:CIC family chloride channel protein
MREATARDAPLLALALLAGLLTGTLGGAFRWAIGKLETYRGDMVESLKQVSDIGVLVPMALTASIAIVAVFLVRRFAQEAGGSGIQELEGALDGLRRMRWYRIIPVKLFGGLMGIGAGMVLGREGPTIQMGGSLGQMLFKPLRKQPDASNVMIAAGAGAGLTAAFTAPLAGILFVIEEMRPQFKYGVLSVHAVILACIGSVIMVRVVVGPEPTMAMRVFMQPGMESLWMFALLGILFGCTGYIFNRLVLFSSGTFGSLNGWRLFLAVGIVGAVIGGLVWFRPFTVGQGDAVAHAALRGDFLAKSLILLFVMRMVTTVMCYGTGTPGGIFAPMLALGTLLSMWFGFVMNDLMPGSAPTPEMFAVAGMAALFAASVRAPLTGIALTIEITGNYEMILPLLVTCVTATLVAHQMGGHPIYTDLLHQAMKRDGQKVS